MDKIIKKMEKLQQEILSLEKELKINTRERETLMNKNGITFDDLNTFEAKLSPGAKKVLSDRRKEMEKKTELTGNHIKASKTTRNKITKAKWV